MYPTHQHCCEPPKICGIENMWTKKVRYDEKCQCPKLATNEPKREQFILQGENCSERASDEKIQQFCQMSGICGMKLGADSIETGRCELNIQPNDHREIYMYKENYDVGSFTCKCRLEQKYYKNLQCVAKPCKDLCNTIDVKLESCDFDYSKPNDPVDCRCIEGYSYAPNATGLYASVCELNSPDQDFIIDPKTGERHIDTGGSLTAVIILGIVGALILISAIMFCFKNKIEACIQGTPADLNNREKYNTQSSRKGLVTDGSRNSSPKSAAEEHDLESQSLKNKVSEENVVSSPVTTHI